MDIKKLFQMNKKEFETFKGLSVGVGTICALGAFAWQVYIADSVQRFRMEREARATAQAVCNLEGGKYCRPEKLIRHYSTKNGDTYAVIGKDHCTFFHGSDEGIGIDKVTLDNEDCNKVLTEYDHRQEYNK